MGFLSKSHAPHLGLYMPSTRACSNQQLSTSPGAPLGLPHWRCQDVLQKVVPGPWIAHTEEAQDSLTLFLFCPYFPLHCLLPFAMMSAAWLCAVRAELKQSVAGRVKAVSLTLAGLSREIHVLLLLWEIRRADWTWRQVCTSSNKLRHNSLCSKWSSAHLLHLQIPCNVLQIWAQGPLDDKLYKEGRTRKKEACF